MAIGRRALLNLRVHRSRAMRSTRAANWAFSEIEVTWPPPVYLGRSCLSSATPSPPPTPPSGFGKAQASVPRTAPYPPPVAQGVRLHVACPGDLLLPKFPLVQCLVLDAPGHSIHGDDQLHFARPIHQAPPESCRLRIFRRGLSKDWGELVRTHDDRDMFPASPDEPPTIVIHSL